MIKAKMELSPKNIKPYFDLTYGRKLWRSMIIEIIFIIFFVTLYVLYGKIMLTVVNYAFKGTYTPQSLALIVFLVVSVLMTVVSFIRVIMCVKALLKIRRADDKIVGTHEFEFGEDGVFSRVTREGFLCERFSVYSTVYSVTEYKESFIVRTRGLTGVFAVSDICDGDADKLRELLRGKIGERFRVKK